MEISTTVLTLDFDLITATFVGRTMERLGDVSEEVNKIFQCIRARFADIGIGNAISEDLRVIPNCRHNAASRPAIAVEV